MASNSKSKGIKSSIGKTESPKKAAIHKIIENPKQYIAAFNILLRAWIRANIELGNPLIDVNIRFKYHEIVSHEMPPDFMVWYFDKRRTMVAKFNKFNMFRQEHGDKIKATAVIQQSHLSVPVATGTYDMSAIAAADAFGPPAREGGRKKRKQTRRMRRTRIIRTRRHRGQNRKSRK